MIAAKIARTMENMVNKKFSAFVSTINGQHPAMPVQEHTHGS